MVSPTVITWILIVFGVFTCGPLLAAQLTILIKPKGQKAKDILIGKGQEWRDKTHFKSAYGGAWADWLIFMPIFVLAIIGIILKKPWGYILFAIAGSIQIYINTMFWFMEKEYVYPTCGSLAYYTYFWGNFMYWGSAALIYSMLRLHGITI